MALFVQSLNRGGDQHQGNERGHHVPQHQPHTGEPLGQACPVRRQRFDRTLSRLRAEPAPRQSQYHHAGERLKWWEAPGYFQYEKRQYQASDDDPQQHPVKHGQEFLSRRPRRPSAGLASTRTALSSLMRPVSARRGPFQPMRREDIVSASDASLHPVGPT
jgi:hypothetical protein